MTAFVECIFISPDAGLPMQLVERVMAIAGVGLEGDRYAFGRGAWQRTAGRGLPKHITLIEIESIEIANGKRQEQFTPIETRRNILTSGVQLNKLIGKNFMVGGVALKGIELADPCPRPSTLAGKKDKQSFTKLFAGMGGLRCAILSSGIIARNDTIVL